MANYVRKLWLLYTPNWIFHRIFRDSLRCLEKKWSTYQYAWSTWQWTMWLLRRFFFPAIFSHRFFTNVLKWPFPPMVSQRWLFPWCVIFFFHINHCDTHIILNYTKIPSSGNYPSVYWCPHTCYINQYCYHKLLSYIHLCNLIHTIGHSNRH